MPSSKSTAIPIPISSPIKETKCVCNFFDPTKASPPNEFLRKLQVRVRAFEYESFSVKNAFKCSNE